jgi:serine/threonine-protein kinase
LAGSVVVDGAMILSAVDEAHVQSTLPCGHRIGAFEVVAPLGAGGMGTVYRAFDERLRREVAIKTILLARTGHESVERFFHEARAVGTLAHPNIIGVFDMELAGDQPYLVLELAARGSLKQRMERGDVDAATVRSVGIQIALALEAAHARGILHRDVKPANILETDPGTFKLADFGIAKLPDSTLTMTGMFLGSPAYAAPESIGAGQFSPASDVYSLAATLHELLSGEPPYGRGAGLATIISKAVHDGPPSLAQHPGVPADLAVAIHAALATEPAARPTASAFAHALATGSAENAVVVAPVSGATQYPAVAAASMTFTGPADDELARRRRRWILLGAALALLLVGIIAATSGDSPHAGATVAPAAGIGAPRPAAADDRYDEVVADPDEDAAGEYDRAREAADAYERAVNHWDDEREAERARERRIKGKKKGKKRR